MDTKQTEAWGNTPKNTMYAKRTWSTMNIVIGANEDVSSMNERIRSEERMWQEKHTGLHQ